MSRTIEKRRLVSGKKGTPRRRHCRGGPRRGKAGKLGRYLARRLRLSVSQLSRRRGRRLYVQLVQMLVLLSFFLSHCLDFSPSLSLSLSWSEGKCTISISPTAGFRLNFSSFLFFFSFLLSLSQPPNSQLPSLSLSLSLSPGTYIHQNRSCVSVLHTLARLI